LFEENKPDEGCTCFARPSGSKPYPPPDTKLVLGLLYEALEPSKPLPITQNASSSS
jgi:hypothetical protein